MTFAVGLSGSLNRVADGLNHASAEPVQVFVPAGPGGIRVVRGGSTYVKSIKHAGPSGAQRRVRGRSTRKKAELQAARLARERFERHFGAVDLGYPTSADNEEIDADLEREYANVVKPA